MGFKILSVILSPQCLRIDIIIYYDLITVKHCRVMNVSGYNFLIHYHIDMQQRPFHLFQLAKSNDMQYDCKS